MERVTFIVSDTGQRISCLLNPEQVVQRRSAGLRRPYAGSGPVSAAAVSDDILLHTGGGRTEIDLDLLFDTELAADRTAKGEAAVVDVRDLTRPLWDLAENRQDLRDQARVSSVRFFWGNRWNVLCVVVAVAERLERFDPTGTPTRSWLRLRLVRVPEPTPQPIEPALDSLPQPQTLTEYAQGAAIRDVHAALIPGTDADGNVLGGERLDTLADLYYPGRPWLWRLIAAVNDIVDGPFAPPGESLLIPQPPPTGNR